VEVLPKKRKPNPKARFNNKKQVNEEEKKKAPSLTESESDDEAVGGYVNPKAVGKVAAADKYIRDNLRKRESKAIAKDNKKSKGKQ
jgi:hypothetical protein